MLGSQGPLLREAALREGFNTNALVLTEELVRTWARAGASTGVFWPTNQVSQWLLKKFVARTPDEWLVMGLIYPATNRVEAAALTGLSTKLAGNRALLSGWELLGSTTLKRVQAKMWQLVAPMVLLVLASLWFAFRRPTEILLGAAVLLLSGLCLLATMAVAGWSWNLMNLMALPLMLGAGVDYTIFIQLALRRHGGDLSLVRRSVGRALMLCGGTAMAGFGSLGFSSNPGMASLGRVCAAGIGTNMVISVFLLPAWWVWLTQKAKGERLNAKVNPKSEVRPSTLDSRPSTPSAFYRAGLWRFGLAVVRILPVGLVKSFSVIVAELYFLFRRQRREVVVQNFLPVFAGDRVGRRKSRPPAPSKVRREAGGLVARRGRRAGAKLADQSRRTGNHPDRAQRGSGMLFITLHLGNWEHGGLLLTQLGIRLTILTQAEPDDGLTDLRIASRAAFRSRDPDHRPGQFRLCGGHQTTSGRAQPWRYRWTGRRIGAGCRWNFSATRLKRRWRRRNWRGRRAAH